jgi:hypothetical protein
MIAIMSCRWVQNDGFQAFPPMRIFYTAAETPRGFPEILL